ncbi:hypothetical protein vBCbaSRXM_32 [Citromicrobium phage vB_CbaS-RXM]|nr:hypothetical protein vBCbaSRXM_32 [Citromicrobium phage vB_CbaS-RXM]
MKTAYFSNRHNITLQHDRLETEAKEAISAIMPNAEHGRAATEGLVKLVKAAFFSGRQQVIDEINGPGDQPERLLLSFCGCGAPTCTDVWFRNLGKFTQGSGFTMADALRLKLGWDLAAPGGDLTCVTTGRVTPEGTFEVLTMQTLDAEPVYEIDDEIGMSVTKSDAVRALDEIREGTFYSDYDFASGPGLRALTAAVGNLPDSAPHGWVFVGRDGEWYWSVDPDFHESVEEWRPATPVEFALANRRKPISGTPVERAIDELRSACNAKNANSPAGQTRIEAAMQRIRDLRGNTMP